MRDSTQLRWLLTFTQPNAWFVALRWRAADADRWSVWVWRCLAVPRIYLLDRDRNWRPDLELEHDGKYVEDGLVPLICTRRQLQEHLPWLPKRLPQMDSGESHDYREDDLRPRHTR